MKNIPKIAHFYWGNSVLPYLRYLTLYSFKKYNPDWEVILYIPKVLQPKMSWTSSEHKFPINCKDYTNKLKDLDIKIIPFNFEEINVSNSLSEVLKSDFLRWYLLSTQGGLWSDMDILFFRSVKQIVMDENVNTVLCFQNGIWSVGFMMSSSENRVFNYLHNVAQNAFNPQTYQSLGSILLARNFSSIQEIHTKFTTSSKFLESHIHNLPMDVVYPVDPVKINQIYDTNNMNLLKINTIGLHWYAGKQILGHWINKIDETTYTQYNNVVCNLVREVIS